MAPPPVPIAELLRKIVAPSLQNTLEEPDAYNAPPNIARLCANVVFPLHSTVEETEKSIPPPPNPAAELLNTSVCPLHATVALTASTAPPPCMAELLSSSVFPLHAALDSLT
ncbi:unnamed protein product [Ectocarpus sp. 12 AP-2014]